MRNKFVSVLTILLAAILVLSACSPAAAGEQNSTPANSNLSGTITISGAFALYPMMTVWTDQFSRIYPNVKFDVSTGGAGKGMTDTLAGAVDIGMISRSITADEEAKGAWWVAVTKDAVFPVINAKNPEVAKITAQGISKDTFTKIFITGEITTWGEVVGDPANTDAIHVYTRSDSCGAGDIWAKFMDKTQDDIQGIGVNGDPGILDAVAKDPLGIGYNNLGYVFDLTSGKIVAGVLAAPIDANSNGSADPDEVVDSLSKAVELIASEKYPSPPARLEYLATKGKPGGLVQAFIQWILTDGQQYVTSAGFVQLPPEQLTASLEKVK